MIAWVGILLIMIKATLGLIVGWGEGMHASLHSVGKMNTNLALPRSNTTVSP
jgi:hypothetical protein